MHRARRLQQAPTTTCATHCKAQYSSAFARTSTPPECGFARVVAWRRHALESVLPLSSGAAGMRNDARIASSLVRYDLEAIQTPTLVVSVRDDLYGTFAAAQYTALQVLARDAGIRVGIIGQAGLRPTPKSGSIAQCAPSSRRPEAQAGATELIGTSGV